MNVTPEISPGFRKKFDGFCQGSGGGVIKWDPTNLLVPAKFWLDSYLTDYKTGGAQDFLTLRASSFVTNWEDRLGNVDFAQAIEANQPAIATVNGIRYVNPTGAIQYLTSSYTPPADSNYCFMVFRNDTEIGNRGVFTSLNAVAFVIGNDLRLGKVSVQQNHAGQFLSDTEIHSGLFDCEDEIGLSAGYEFWQDGTIKTPSVASFSAGWTNGELEILANSDRVWGFDGLCSEIIWLEAEPVELERQKIEGYLAWHAHDHGVTDMVDNLPALHPYKTEAPTV